LTIAPSRRAAPKDFLWGVAISAHQSEGNNVNSDIWLAENVKPTLFVEPSGNACDSYHRFAEDIAIAADLGFNCYRFGIEWARIEPEQGQFSSVELDRYSHMLDLCLQRGLAPMVTYNHFSVPLWFAKRGGFEIADGANLFARFAEKATVSPPQPHSMKPTSSACLRLSARPMPNPASMRCLLPAPNAAARRIFHPWSLPIFRKLKRCCWMRTARRWRR
jgi:hypothetical protein